MVRSKRGKGEYPYKDLTETIIGAAIEVHRVLGPGFVEQIYEEAFANELNLRDLKFERQKEVVVYYKDHLIGKHRFDFLVEGEIIVELKAVKALDEIYEAQIISTVKAAHKKIGLLINFCEKRLTDGVRRFII
jgi:GxxExxY protein